MKVPLLDLSAQHKPLHKQIMRSLEKTVRSQIFILGPEVEKLETSVARYCDTKHAIGVSSGTDALLVSLMALGVGSGDEVITTPYTFFSTAGAIARVGAKPVFVDIDPLTFNIDPKKIEPAINKNTKAIIPVHLFGQCAEMRPILDVAKKYRLRVIEDAAQAIGAEYRDGRRAGSMGDLGCFSFFPSKNLGGFGDGGMVVTNNDDLAEKIRTLRVHGSKPKYIHHWIGGNFRLDAIQAAVLNIKFKYLDRWTKKRRENARRYHELFNKSGLVQKGLVQLPTEGYVNNNLRRPHIYNQFVICAKRRDALLNHLKSNGIGSEIYYPLPLHMQECFRPLGYNQGNFPIAEHAALETLALPIYPEISRDQQRIVVQSMNAFYKSLVLS